MSEHASIYYASTVEEIAALSGDKPFCYCTANNRFYVWTGTGWEPPCPPPEAFPVGSVFVSTDETNPNTALGYGTWEAFGAGRTLVGFDAAQTEFDAGGKTGGAKTHTLTVAEMPSHTHTQDAHAHGQSIKNSGTAGTQGTQGASTTNNAAAGTTAPATATNQNTGGGGAHNNLPPFIVCYFWRRTQ